MNAPYPFRLTLALRTNVILIKPMMLDSLLAAAIYHKTGSIDIAHSAIPLHSTEGLWHGSCGTLLGSRRRAAGAGGGDPVAPQPVQFIRSFSLVRDAHRLNGLFESFHASKGPFNKESGADSDLSSFKSRRDIYTSYSASRMTFDGYGDGEACRDLIAAYISFVGKKHTQGYGEVASVDLDQTEEDVSVVAHGIASRNIPLDYATRFNNPRGLVMDNRWKPPYWEGEKVKCVCPLDLVPVKIL